MSEKKNIDRLFQEKFKDFEASPPDFVWDNIYEILQEKKRKRVIPLWMRLSGVAAVLALGTLFGILYFNSINPKDGPVVIDNQPAKQILPYNAFPLDKSLHTHKNVSDGSARGIHSPAAGDGVAAADEIVEVNPNPSQPDNPAMPGSPAKNAAPRHIRTRNADPDAAFSTNNSVAHSGQEGGRTGNRRMAHKKQAVLAQPNSGVAYTGTAKATHKNDPARGNDPVKTARADRNAATGIAYNGRGSAGNLKNNNRNTAGGNTLQGTAVAATQKTQEIQPGAKTTVNGSNGTNKEEGVAEVKTETKTPVIDTNIVVNEQAVAETTVDTTAAKPENELEKLLREQTEGKESEKDKMLADNTNGSKWNIKPQLAPVFYSSLSKGSPIDGQFAGNAKNYNNDLSYGLGIHYAVNKKIKVRSGINAVNLNYSTQDVEFYASLQGQTKNIAARSSKANIVVQDQKSGGGTPNAFTSDQLVQEKFNGSMLQKTGYVEVPVEMSYALLDKKFGIELIGGVSTLFLNQNNVSVTSVQGLSTNVGEAQNLNNIHFSTNLGVGFKYRFFKAFQASFEPMFKYQVNTFSRDAGNFKPYFIGLYSGVSFSF